MEHPHRRDTDPFPDRGKLATFNAFWDRYGRLLMTLVVAGGGWVVAHIWEPIQALPAIQAAHEQMVINDSISLADRKQLKQDTKDLKEVIKILVKMQCLQLSAVDRVKINLDCADVPLPDPSALRRFQSGLYSEGEKK